MFVELVSFRMENINGNVSLAGERGLEIRLK